ncbi:hypothetical protein DIS24_g8551 [Lasiodiplodia hormozganensis]|uniref:Uncharacterized protein n=1 Tax=Lasiodiplodia hormozganensis TaxID=869390 RepID=A0AA39Y2F7_9PEZI|nr:hypothetical protein DIS24_g8551 [Lasiodiplodia hormozganensis]
MADAPSSTPPPQQEQPTRPASFEAKWKESDASFLQPSKIPVPKAHRAWERQPHSPFTRNGKFRKVWKRYELRSQPDTETNAANTEKNSPAKSPRKVVKKRALEAPADPTATPGRKAPKNKAFAPTRWETPRKNSGRIASRKIAQPIFAREPSPDPVHADHLKATTMVDNDDGNSEEDAKEYIQANQPPGNMQDKPMVTGTEDTEAVAEFTTDTKPEDETTAEGNQSEDRHSSIIQSEDASQSLDVEREADLRSETTGEPKDAELDVETHGLSPGYGGNAGLGAELELEDVVIDGGSVSGKASLDAVGSANEANEQDEERTGQEQPGTDITANLEASVLAERELGQKKENEGVQEGCEKVEVDADAVMGDQTPSSLLEPRPSESSVQDNAADEKVEAPAAQPESSDVTSTVIEADAMTCNSEQVGAEMPSTDESLPKELAAMQDEDGLSLEQRLQADAAETLGSGSTLEEDEVLLSEEETDESEHLEEDDLTLTEIPESEEDDPANIPSPSLSAAESPRFSSIADTLTLNLPDRTPPKNRTTKEIAEEPASPLDEDTAFLRDFLSRAGASKASREAAATQLETMTKRRDSDIVRQVLGSPRVALEVKDPNSPNAANTDSPSRKTKAKGTEDPSSTTAPDDKKLDLGDITSDLTLEKPAEEPPAPAPAATTPKLQSRRSSRARQTRLPTTPTASNARGPNRIQFRGANGADPVVLRKSEAQELAAATRTNTRKNKGSAVAAPIRLTKLKAEALKTGTAPDAPAPDGSLPVFADPQIDVWLASRLRWDSQLVYFQEQGNLAGLTSLSDDESTEPAETESASQGKKEEGSKKRKGKSEDASSTPARTKRAKGLGAGNGTPAKGLLMPASLLPMDVQAELEKNESTEEEIKEKKSGSGKKASTLPPSISSSKSAGIGSKGGKKSDKAAVKEAQPVEAATETIASSQESNKSDSAPPAPTTAPLPPSQLPTPAISRRSRLQTPRKVKLPVPVSSSISSSTGIPAVSSPAIKAAPAAQAQNNNPPSRLIGSTPRKLAGITKPAASTGDGGSGGGGGGGGGTQGLSAGRRRGAAAAARRG